MPEVTLAEWDSFQLQNPEIHLLQTSAWGELKQGFGWTPIRLISGNISAQLLLRRLPLGYSFAYLPKIPIGVGWDDLSREIDAVCHHHRAIFFKLEPDLWENAPAGSAEAVRFYRDLTPPEGFIISTQSIQPPRTIIVDLRLAEGDILGRMKQKTRYNIKLAQQRDVVISPSHDLALFHEMMQITGKRDKFGFHSLGYYQKAYELFHRKNNCILLQAKYQNQPLAMLMVFTQGKRAWYLYGASNDEHRQRMPNYLLQWEAMRWAKQMGCSSYDLWGVPDADLVTLEANFSQRSDGLWGVYRFKRGFGGELLRSVGPWDRIYQPVMYRFYLWWIKRKGQVL